MTMIHILGIGIGGALGAMLRALVNVSLSPKGEASYWATLSVNLTGCFLIGLLWALFGKGNYSEGMRLFLITGCLGAFTTFSTFGLESLILFNSGKIKEGFFYMLTSNLIGVILVFAGAALGRVFLNLIAR
jgi:fluoride exporter